ncbi:hypothetical protein ACQPZF_05920 [Actinosynnema sp. CS-041913]|uniref:hypothetical protein n=1 Tax=Actinosynnema sp. CS-041913 TaxID=3239917 RepID=UPI003D8F05A4
MTEVRMVFDAIAGAVGAMNSTVSRNIDTGAQQYKFVQDASGSYFTDEAGSELNTTQGMWSKHADQHDQALVQEAKATDTAQQLMMDALAQARRTVAM